MLKYNIFKFLIGKKYIDNNEDVKNNCNSEISGALD